MFDFAIQNQLIYQLKENVSNSFIKKYQDKIN